MSGIKCPHCAGAIYPRGKYMQGVTRAQGDIVNLLAQRAMDGQITPTVAEIAAALGFKAKSQVSEKLRALQQRGFVEKVGERNAARNIRLTQAAWALYQTMCQPHA